VWQSEEKKTITDRQASALGTEKVQEKLRYRVEGESQHLMLEQENVTMYQGGLCLARLWSYAVTQGLPDGETRPVGKRFRWSGRRGVVTTVKKKKAETRPKGNHEGDGGDRADLEKQKGGKTS